MEKTFDAIFGEIVNRSISFLIDKYSQITTITTAHQRLHNLQRLLLRVRIIVEEAEGRNITNQAMVHKLNILRKEMYRGYFIIDNFRSQASEEEKSKDHDVSNLFAVSNFSPAKRIFFSIGNTHGEKDLQQVLGNLNNIIVDMSKFLELLKTYSPMHRQPYSMHMFLGRCMFGRQMEMERIMNFLMIEPPGTKDVGILPIVGLAAIGKSTLVTHVCNDERVHNNFTQIIFITEYDIKDKGANSFKDGDVIMHKNNSMNGDERTLVIIEFSGDVDEAVWKIYLASASCLASVVKIVITSRSSKIKDFGTTEALILHSLPPEASWYFFKVLTFGSVDPKDHPKLESIALDISRGRAGSFVGTNLISSLLRDHFDVKHWHMVRTILTAHAAGEVITENNPKYVKMLATDDYFAIYPCDGSFTEDMAPKTTLLDLVCGRGKYEGRFQVLAWKSLIPPYKSYLCTCEIQPKLGQRTKKKRL